MGLSRGIANIVTCGAVSKVDAAAESYKRTFSKYEEYRNLGQEIKSLQDEINQLKSELKKKEALIKKIYSNPKTRERLSSIETKALQEYKNCTNHLPNVPEFSTNTLGYWDWEDSIAQNLSIIIATTVIPIGGVIGAHESANEKVIEIQNKEKEVLDAIRKIQPQALKMIKIKEEYKLSLKTLSTVESVIERFSNE